MKLAELSPLMARRRGGGLNFTFGDFRADPALAPLCWPDDAIEQFLYDHGDNPDFARDYRDIALEGIAWSLDMIPTADFDDMPTGASEADCIEYFAENPMYWVKVSPAEVGHCWEERGTWMRPPILIDRRLLAPSNSGLQVLEGRTPVGVLRGGLRVASHHQAWVGRP